MFHDALILLQPYTELGAVIRMAYYTVYRRPPSRAIAYSMTQHAGGVRKLEPCR